MQRIHQLSRQENLFSIKYNRIRNHSYFIALDEAKYLALARNLPHYSLFKGPYLAHPPVFPLLIKVVSFFVGEREKGAVFLSFFCSLMLFPLFIMLMRLLRWSNTRVGSAVVFLAFFELPRMYSQLIMKESLFVLECLLVICSFMAALLLHKKFVFLVILFGAMAALSADQGLFLAPVMVIIYWSLSPWSVERATKKRIILILSLGSVVLPYAGWLYYRWHHYQHSGLIPVGVDGTLEQALQGSWQTIFNPHLFPCSASLMNFKFTLDMGRIAYRLNELFECTIPFTMLSSLFQLLVFMGLLTSLLSFLPLRKPDKIGKVSLLHSSKAEAVSPEVSIPDQRVVLMTLGILAVFLFPLTNRGTQARMMMTVLPFIAMACVIGMHRVVILFSPSHVKLVQRLAAIVCVMMLSFGSILILWQAEGTLSGLQFEFESTNVAAWLQTRPEQIVLAQAGYPPELAYLSGKTVLGFPCDAESLHAFLNEHTSALLLFGEHYLGSIDDPGKRVFGREVINEILQNRREFQFLTQIEESYHTVNWPDRVQIFRYVPVDSHRPDTGWNHNGH